MAEKVQSPNPNIYTSIFAFSNYAASCFYRETSISSVSINTV